MQKQSMQKINSELAHHRATVEEDFREVELARALNLSRLDMADRWAKRWLFSDQLRDEFPTVADYLSIMLQQARPGVQTHGHRRRGNG